ncbi:MAG: class I SAM-dependent methyltransferase [Bacteroidales bacterium]|nr:class I SAM-dependent methyltransferase [Bacteroidales bacterium]
MKNIKNKNDYFGRDLEAMSTARNYPKWIISEFKPYIGQHVAEVGAGSGNITALLTEHVEKLVAFEPSENMFPLLKKRFGKVDKITAINNYFGNEYLNFKECFDSLLYVNVLEHIKDDRQEIDFVYKALKPGGYLLVFVPALPFLYGEFDKNVGHYRRYTKKSIIRLVQNSGFKIARLKYFDFAGIIPWYITFVLLKSPMTNLNVGLYDKIVVPVARRIEKFLTPPIGKNLLLVLQKSN